MPKQNKKFVVVSFRASREPLDDMIWAEAVYDGVWTNVTHIEKVKTRREILERISELESAVVGIDVPFGFAKPFVEFLGKEGMTGWTQIARTIREDLKKNTEDGIKLWVERMGRYRESNLETEEEANRHDSRPIHNRSGRRFQEPRAPYELLSKSERYRRIDQIVKRITKTGIEPTHGIRYNKLTSRYDFLNSEAQGRRALLCISLLAQLIEQHPTISVWPFKKPADVTVVEVNHAIFPKPPKAQELAAYFDKLEDNAIYIDNSSLHTLTSTPAATSALFTLLGMLSAERRENKAIRPLRDYRDNFYENELVKTEGWTYGIGFKDSAQSTQPKETQTTAAVEPATVPAPHIRESAVESDISK